LPLATPSAVYIKTLKGTKLISARDGRHGLCDHTVSTNMYMQKPPSSTVPSSCADVDLSPLFFIIHMAKKRHTKSRGNEHRIMGTISVR